MAVDEMEPNSADGSEITLDEAQVSDAGSSGAEDAGASADPSAAQDQGEKGSLLDVVRDVVAKRPAAPPAETSDGQDKKLAAQTDPTKRDDDNFTDVPFHKHPRFQELVAQRNEFKKDATRYQHLTNFLDENAVSNEEAARALNLAALMKRDPAEAWKELKPLVQDLLLRTGDILPTDLRQQVAAGQLTKDAAVMVARERAKATQLQGRADFDQQVAARRQQNEAATREQEAATARRNAVAEWESAKRGPKGDPDFDKHYEDIEKELLWLHRRDGPAKDPAGVQKQLETAYKAVKARFAAAQPRRPGINPVTGGRVAGNPRTEPKTMLDVVRMNRAVS